MKSNAISFQVQSVVLVEYIFQRNPQQQHFICLMTQTTSLIHGSYCYKKTISSIVPSMNQVIITL